MNATPIAVIVNPNSANGRTGRIWPRLHSRLRAALGELTVLPTLASGHAAELSQTAVRSGHRTLVVVGGDGTAHEVVNGLMRLERQAVEQVTLAVLVQGTGGDLRRSFKLPGTVEGVLASLASGNTRSVDVMEISFRDLEGKPAVRYGINIASFGMGGAVAARVNRSNKALGGKISFLWATLATTLTFPGNRVSVQFEGGGFENLEITNVAIGNGSYHGGGMCSCPRAVPDDGLLDVTIIRKLSLWEIVRDLPYLYNGKIHDHPKVMHARSTRVVATSEDTTLIEIDGESPGRLPAEIKILPRALRFVI